MNRQFPAFRGLAIFLVILNHSITLGLWNADAYSSSQIGGVWGVLLLVLVQLGIFAVPVFLFISGSFFVYAARGSDPKLSYKTVWSGLKNILWPYLIWSVAFYVLIYVLNGERYSLLGYVKNLIVGYPNNFVPLMMFFYLLSPMIVKVGKRHGLALLVMAGLYQIFLLNVVYPGILGFAFPHWTWYFTPPVLRTTMALWGIYFPLGVIYSLHSKRINPVLYQLRWLLGITTALLFMLAVINEVLISGVAIAASLAPLFFMLCIPVIKRESIPFYRQLENIGRRAYGLYLTNLVVLNLIILAVQAIASWLNAYQLLLLVALVFLALEIPVLLMRSVERLPRLGVYRYMFG
jgi:surface polysaccharide O-acyltransferase-like enzyme